MGTVPPHTGRYAMMGVSGAGKSLIGPLLARALGVTFVDGDDLHPAENVARMAAGIALTDDDRRGWLLAIAARLREAKRAGIGLVVSCSALRRSYRDVLRCAGGADVRFVDLARRRALVAGPLSQRRGHCSPAPL